MAERDKTEQKRLARLARAKRDTTFEERLGLLRGVGGLSRTGEQWIPPALREGDLRSQIARDERRIGEINEELHDKEKLIRRMADVEEHIQAIEKMKVSDAVKTYLTALAMQQLSLEEGEGDPDFVENWNDRSQVMGRWLQMSRLFEVDGQLFADLVERIADFQRDMSPEEVVEATRAMGTPEYLPYPSTFIGFSGARARLRGIEGDSLLVDALMFLENGQGVSGITMWNSTTWNSTTEPGALWSSSLDWMALYREDGWRLDDDNWVKMAPVHWAAVAVIDAINSHRTVILEAPLSNKADRRKLKDLTRTLDLKLKPRPFYKAQLNNRLCIRAMRRLQPVRAHLKWSYRTDVRKHERVRVQRGPLPLDPATKRKLLRPRQGSGNHYRIYETEPLSPVDEERLYVRGVRPKGRSEWVALLVSIVDEHIAGPEGAPYVPKVQQVSTLHPTHRQD